MARASVSHLPVSTSSCLRPWRQAIELGAPVVLGRAVVEVDPAALDQPVERRIQRPLLHLQHVVGAALDGLGDGVAVGRAEPQGPQDQHVERALQQFDASCRLLFGRHPRCCVRLT